MSDPIETPPPADPAPGHTELPDRFGPVHVVASDGEAYGGTRYSGEGSPGESASIVSWTPDALSDSQLILLTGLIERLQECDARGVARLMHGSVTPEHVALAFERPPGERLSDRLMRGTTSAVEAISGAMSLVEGITALAEWGVAPGWWSADLVWVPTDQPTRWTLSEPGVIAIAVCDERPAPRDLGEAAVCAPELATGSVPADTDDPAALAAMVSYGIGATLFYVLSGELPKNASDPGGYLRRQLAADPRKLTEPVPFLARYSLLVQLVDECLQRAPGERPTDLKYLQQRLAEARHEAERLDSDVAFLPARVTDTMEIRRSMLRERTDEHQRQPLPDRRVQFAALVMLVSILLFLITRQASSHVRPDRAPPDPAPTQTTSEVAADPAELSGI